jgi:hypothetical protein
MASNHGLGVLVFAVSFEKVGYNVALFGGVARVISLVGYGMGTSGTWARDRHVRPIRLGCAALLARKPRRALRWAPPPASSRATNEHVRR